MTTTAIVDIFFRLLDLTPKVIGPYDRIEGMRNTAEEPPMGLEWLWYLGAAVAFALLVAGVAALAVGISGRRRRTWQEFDAQAQRLGLNDEERNLLAYLVRLGHTKNPVSIFTMEQAFHQAASTFTAGRHVASMSPDNRAYTINLLGGLCEKLGFHAGDGDDQMSLISSRQLSEGATISVLHRGSADTFRAVISRSNAAELEVLPDMPVDCESGESWLVRYCDGGSVWEFDAPVIGSADGRVVLSHSDRMRFINRRRFPRIPTDRPAMLAAFPFSRPEGTSPNPQFAPSKLIEIAGPGFRLEVPNLSELGLRVGERALVVITMRPDRIVEGLGKVRRLFASESGALQSVAIEMIGLNASEVAELARETNAASQQQARSATGSQSNRVKPAPVAVPV